MESVTVIGNLGRDPELRFTPNGKSVLDLGLATYGGKDESGEKQTIWIKATLWGDLAERANQSLQKGNRVLVAGYFKEPRVWQSTDGENHASIELTAFVCKLVASTTEINTSELPEFSPEPDKKEAREIHRQIKEKVAEVK